LGSAHDASPAFAAGRRYPACFLLGQRGLSMEVSMRTLRWWLVVPAVLVALCSSAAFAQDSHVVDRAALADAVAGHVSQQDADRAAVREALGHPDVRGVAAKTGIDVDRLAAAVDTMSGADLARAADSARQVNEALVGGQSTVVISTTTIIIVLLIVILIVVAAD
jgi:hypothetical protein